MAIGVPYHGHEPKGDARSYSKGRTENIEDRAIVSPGGQRSVAGTRVPQPM